MHNNVVELKPVFNALSPSAAQDSAEDGYKNLEAFRPVRYDAPPSWLANAIDAARQHARSGNLSAAKDTVTNASSDEVLAADLGKYRAHVTWVEAENAARLATLEWIWRTLRARTPSVQLDKALERIERFANQQYGVTEFSRKRGWAETQVYSPEILPAAWRRA